MCSCLRLAQVEFGPATNNLAAKLDKRLEHLLEVKYTGLSVDDSNIDDAE